MKGRQLSALFFVYFLMKFIISILVILFSALIYSSTSYSKNHSKNHSKNGASSFCVKVTDVKMDAVYDTIASSIEGNIIYTDSNSIRYDSMLFVGVKSTFIVPIDQFGNFYSGMRVDVKFKTYVKQKGGKYCKVDKVLYIGSGAHWKVTMISGSLK